VVRGERLPIRTVLLQQAIQHTLLERLLDIVEHVEDVVLVRGPISELLEEGEITSVRVDERMEQPVAVDERHRGGVLRIVIGDAEPEFEDAILVVSLVHKEDAIPGRKIIRRGHDINTAWAMFRITKVREFDHQLHPTKAVGSELRFRHSVPLGITFRDVLIFAGGRGKIATGSTKE